MFERAKALAQRAWNTRPVEAFRDARADSTGALVDGISRGIKESGEAAAASMERNAAKFGHFVGNPTSIVTKPAKFAWKAGKVAAIGAALVGGLALFAHSNKRNTVAAPETEDLSQGAEQFAANVPQEPMLPPLQLGAQPTSTLMGEEPVAGEWAARMRGGAGAGERKFADVAPPRTALDAGFEDISTVPSRA